MEPGASALTVIALGLGGAVLLVLLALPAGPPAWAGGAVAAFGLAALAIYTGRALVGGKM